MAQPCTNILVVDDYANMRIMLKNMLRQLGMRDVDMANDGGAALSLLPQRPYRLIVSDWNMEPMTGLQLLQSVQTNPQLRATPFIMVTGSAEAAIDARKLGASATIIKPFSAINLKEAVAQALAAV